MIVKSSRGILIVVRKKDVRWQSVNFGAMFSIQVFNLLQPAIQDDTVGEETLVTGNGISIRRCRCSLLLHGCDNSTASVMTTDNDMLHLEEEKVGRVLGQCRAGTSRWIL